MAAKKKAPAKKPGAKAPLARGKKTAGLKRFKVQVPGGMGGRDTKVWVDINWGSMAGTVEAKTAEEAAQKLGLHFDPAGWETPNRAPAKVVPAEDDDAKTS